MFVGRVLSITESYDAGKGITLKLKAVDALYELAKITLRGLKLSEKQVNKKINIFEELF